MARVIKRNDAVPVSAIGPSAESLLPEGGMVEVDIAQSAEAESTKSIKTAEQYQQCIDDLKRSNGTLESQNASLSSELLEVREEMKNLEADIEKHRTRGFEQGHEEGVAAGLDRIKQQVDVDLRQVKMVIEALEGEFKDQFLMKEDDIKDVIMTALLKLIGTVPSEEIVKIELDKVIQSMSKTEEMYVHLSNEDFDKLQATEYVKRLPACISFVADSKILPGGIMVQAQSESLDARLDRKLMLFKEQLVSV